MLKPEEGATTRLKAAPSLTALELKQRAANVIVHLRLKPTSLVLDSPEPRPHPTHTYTVDGQEFSLYDDLPLNRRGYKYKPCRRHVQLAANMYLTVESAPYGVRTSYFDRASGVAVSDDLASVTTTGGWLSARANVAMRAGRHYFEYDIVRANDGGRAHVRVGVARREAALEAPVGFDGYGYAVRDMGGERVTLSRPRGYMPRDAGGFRTGDTLGFLVELPDGGDNTPNIVRDQLPIKYKSSLYFEQFEYTASKQMAHMLNPVTVFGEKAVLTSAAAPQLPTLPGSRIVVYKNGECMGPMFEDLYLYTPHEGDTAQLQNPAYKNTDDGLLGYYPMMSVFSGGVVRLNPGPEFKHAIPEGARPLSDRYSEKVVEEWYWDLVDEVEAQYLDSFD